MVEKRRLLIGGVYQQPGWLKWASPLMVEICDEFEPHRFPRHSKGQFANQPFTLLDWQ